MDDAQLKKILTERKTPLADDNAKKRALNLALIEFDNHQKEKEKKFQGLPFIGRLIGSSNQTNRRRPMRISRPFMYGGSLASIAFILFAYNSMLNTTGGDRAQSITAATLQKASFAVDGGTGGNNFSSIASNVTTPSPTYFQRKENRQDAQIADGRLNKSKDEAFAGERARRVEMDAVGTKKSDSMAEMNAPQMPLASSPQKQAEVKAVREAEAVAKIAGKADVLMRGVTVDNGPTASNMAVMGGAPASIVATLSDAEQQQYYQDVGRDKFQDFEENPVKAVATEPVSTFSIDVDTASYSFMRRQINNGVLPQKDAVRIEELVNYFDYNYALPETKAEPFKPTVTVLPSPWKEGNKLLHIGIKGYDIGHAEQPRSNLVFLLDTSGSMNSPDKLPLVINSLKLLLDTLKPDDTVGIVVYAGSAGTVLEPTKVSDKASILAALDRLNAGGSTAGAEGIRQAYQLAESNFDKNAVNRVILATDGDFNVGITNPEELKDFVERKRDTGVFLSVLGFGQGNLNDQMMQTLAQNGNGVAAYIDTLGEARKVLVQEATSTLFPIAKDVKIQIEFNPKTVAEYRLVGYETRHLNQEDFNNDAVDAGDIGAGHAVTAIYEITPVGGPVAVDALRYQGQKTAPEHPANEVWDGPVPAPTMGNEYAFLKIRYKLPDEDTSHLITTPVTHENDRGWDNASCDRSDGVCKDTWAKASDDAGFSVAVATFGELLKGGKYAGHMTFDDVINMAQQAKGTDEFGYRAEFINLVRLAKSAADLQKN